MFGIVGGEARRRPGYSPWTEALVVLAIVGTAVGGIALATDWFSAKSTPVAQPGQQVQIGPAPEVNPSAQTELEVAVSVTMPVIQMEWVKIGTARNGEEVLALPVLWEKSKFVSWPLVQETLNFPLQEVVTGRGDGTVFLLYGDRVEREFYLTPNQGRNWYRVPKPQGGEPGAAYLEGDIVVLLMARQVEPWIYEYSKAKMPLSKLEGLHP